MGGAQYAVLVHMIAQVTGFEAGELVHVIADAHIYDRHLPIVEEIIAHDGYDAPAFSLNPAVRDFYDFTVDDVQLDGYDYWPLDVKIPVAE